MVALWTIFYGSERKLDTLHFDCLLTNNIFFQIKGRKRFSLIRPQDGQFCGRHNWRWYELNPEKPDHKKFPNISQVTIDEFIVSAGDLLYIPPGRLHAVV